MWCVGIVRDVTTLGIMRCGIEFLESMFVTSYGCDCEHLSSPVRVPSMDIVDIDILTNLHQ